MRNEKIVNPSDSKTPVASVNKNTPVNKQVSDGTHKTNIVSGAPIKTANKSIKAVLFGKENYKWMLIGLVVMAIGFFLMSGGKSSNPNVFNDEDVYSTTRITIAPILIIAGLIIEIFAIMKKSR